MSDTGEINRVNKMRPSTEPCGTTCFGIFGITGYYLRHIENYSQRVLPLNKLTNRNKPDKFEINAADLAEFNDLRNALINLPVLQSPKLNVPFILKVDCSQFCCGVALIQEINWARAPSFISCKEIFATRK